MAGSGPRARRSDAEGYWARPLGRSNPQSTAIPGMHCSGTHQPTRMPDTFRPRRTAIGSMTAVGHSRRLSDILGMSASPSTPAVLRTAANRRDCQEETSRPFCVHPQPRVVLFESCQRDVPKSCFRSGSGDAVGGHHTGHSFFLPVRAAFTVPVRTGACARNLRTQGGMQ